MLKSGVEASCMQLVSEGKYPNVVVSQTLSKVRRSSEPMFPAEAKRTRRGELQSRWCLLMQRRPCVCAARPTHSLNVLPRDSRPE
eukprot:6192490-Pleurochrysis_carterae.AAC.2